MVLDSRFPITIPPMSDIETSYNSALDYLYSFVDYSLKHSSELAKADFNLDRMRALMAELGNPQDQYPIIHVAGTKGKGSVCALIASVACRQLAIASACIPRPICWITASGFRSTASPFRTQTWWIWSRQSSLLVASIPKLTTFEITTALAFLHFAAQHVDAAVIEVGLGGRLDATNVVAPNVSVITSLSYDHMAVLGNTPAQIAGEKAGIIKPGVPVVSAPQKNEALEVLVQDREGTRMLRSLWLAAMLRFEALSHSLDGQSLKVEVGGNEHTLTIPLLGFSSGSECGRRCRSPLDLARPAHCDFRMPPSTRVWRR